VSITGPSRPERKHRISEKRRQQYRFSILLIDDMQRIGLERFYRITIRCIKEINMNRLLNTALAAAFAFALTFGSIGAIVTVPSAQAAAPTAFELPVIA
jgi:hypothetical protein